MKELTTIENYDSLKELSAAAPVLILKHSTACPRSAEAHAQFTKFVFDRKFENAAILDLLAYRSVSNHIAEDTGIQHESPQVFLFVSGKPVWHAHHWNVTGEKIDEALASYGKR